MLIFIIALYYYYYYIYDNISATRVSFLSLFFTNLSLSFSLPNSFTASPQRLLCERGASRKVVNGLKVKSFFNGRYYYNRI